MPYRFILTTVLLKKGCLAHLPSSITDFLYFLYRTVVLYNLKKPCWRSFVEHRGNCYYHAAKVCWMFKPIGVLKVLRLCYRIKEGSKCWKDPLEVNAPTLRVGKLWESSRDMSIIWHCHRRPARGVSITTRQLLPGWRCAMSFGLILWNINYIRLFNGKSIYTCKHFYFKQYSLA